MRVRALPLVVLLAAATALVVSVGAVAWTDDDNGGWMMNRDGSGMMGYSTSGTGDPVRGLAAAKRQAQDFASELGLQVGEVMRFTNNYYAQLREDDGSLATEVLVEPASGAVDLEYGPAMMWNTRYGMMSDFRLRDAGGMMSGSMMGGSGMGMMGGSGNGMMDGAGTGMMNGGDMIGRAQGGVMGRGGMMGGNGMMGEGYADPTWTPGATGAEVTPANAQRLAQSWLDRQSSELTAGEPEALPGYYTLHVLRDGKVAGMLSVNAATGAVWSHWWHGRFVSMLED